MWKRFIHKLRCLECEGELELMTIEEHRAPLSRESLILGESLGMNEAELSHYIDTGIASCVKCKLWHPIIRGLPVMLPFITPHVQNFSKQYSGELRSLGKKYSHPDHKPEADEKSVLKTFSREWLDYPSGDALWTWTHEQREAIFLAEIGGKAPPEKNSTFLELGCGLGIVTSFAQKSLKGDAIGADLSLAAGIAAQKFKDNPFSHFIQASLWKIPLEKNSFDVTYSHGVLHHTCSTKKAFAEMARFCKPGGLCYLWIYGDKSINANFGRRAAFALESLLRPVLSRSPDAISTIALSPVACAYVIISRFQKLTGRKDMVYNFPRGLHAARDRFTPRFAHRTTLENARSWFQELGFTNIREIPLSDLPPEARETFKRNIGLIAVKS